MWNGPAGCASQEAAARASTDGLPGVKVRPVMTAALPGCLPVATAVSTPGAWYVKERRGGDDADRLLSWPIARPDRTRRVKITAHVRCLSDGCWP